MAEARHTSGIRTAARRWMVAFCIVVLTVIADPLAAGSACETVALEGSVRVWFVDPAAGTAGDGSESAPFAALDQIGAASAPGDAIYVLSGSEIHLHAGLHLKRGQKLLGQGVTVVWGDRSFPAVSRTRIVVESGPALSLADRVTVAGVEIRATEGPAVTTVEVRDVELIGVKVTGSGSDGLAFEDAAGEARICGCEVAGAGDDAVTVDATRDSLRIIVQDSLVSGSLEGDGLAITTRASAEVTVEVTDSEVVGHAGAGLRAFASGSSLLSVAVSGSSIRDCGVGLDFVATESARLGLEVCDNREITGHSATIVNVFLDTESSSEARIKGRISGNSSMSKNAGAGHGIRVASCGDGRAELAIRDNAITGGVEYDYGIIAESREGRAHLDIAVVGNRVTVGPKALEPILVQSRDQGVVCAHIQDNITDGGAHGVRVRQRGNSNMASTFQLAGLQHDAVDPAAVMATLRRLNPGASGVDASVDTRISTIGTEKCSGL